ncbi:MAG: isoprenoid biosynthesis glyoxalase ElbB [Bacteroidia bacterium]|nr:isoprenoid biosynthesis glyoxalase ElbB [Bacteroidia bacterium]
MGKQKKIAVVLSGCGAMDGAEIHEATFTLWAIAKNGGSYEIFAPDIPQYHVINYITGDVMKEDRNVLVEAARIARGKIKALSQFRAENFDAIVFPGGYGAAKNLFTYAFDGLNCRVNPEVEKAVKDMAKAKKPIGALCIAPVLIAKILGKGEVTIGNDKGTADDIKKFGGKHKNTLHTEVAVDAENNIFSTPCYMLDATIVQIADGADNLVKVMMGKMAL